MFSSLDARQYIYLSILYSFSFQCHEWKYLFVPVFLGDFISIKLVLLKFIDSLLVAQYLIPYICGENISLKLINLSTL